MEARFIGNGQIPTTTGKNNGTTRTESVNRYYRFASTHSTILKVFVEMKMRPMFDVQ